MTAHVTCPDGTCGLRGCRRCFMIQRRRTVPNKPMWDCWTAQEDQHLRGLAGTAPLEELAARWEADGYLPRTAQALANRCFELDVPRGLQGYTVISLAATLGVSRNTVHCWIQHGYLESRHLSGEGKGARWWIAPAMVETFIRAHGNWLVDLHRVAAGHPLRRLVEVVQRSDPWLPLADLARYVGISNLLHRLAMIPHRARPSLGQRRLKIMVRARDFPAIREAIRASQAESRLGLSARAVANIRDLPRDAHGRKMRRAEVAA